MRKRATTKRQAAKTKEFKRRSLAAQKGWRTRRQNERARSERSKHGWKTRKKNERARKKKKQRAITPSPHVFNIEWLVSIDYNQGKRRKFSADLVIVAPMNATPTELADQARKQLTSGKSFLANWIEGAFADISQGTPTARKPSTKIRSFQRHK